MQKPATTQAVALAAPDGFFAYATGRSEIDLYWKYVHDTRLRHNIYRSTTANVDLTADNRIAREIESPDYHDKGLLAGTTYYYRITAVKDGQESAPSREDGETTFPARKP